MAEPTLTGGQYADCSIQEFRRRLTLAFRDNEESSLPDTALRSVLLDADRIAWELAHARDAIRNAALEEAAVRCGNHAHLAREIRLLKTTPPEEPK